MESRNPDSERPNPWLDVAHLETACDGDAELAQDLLQVFLEHTGHELVELESCIAAGDVAAAQRLAHSVAGSSLAVGAMALAEAARRIERGSALPSSAEWTAFRAVRDSTLEAVSLRLHRAA